MNNHFVVGPLDEMSWLAYEHHVAEVLRAEGWAATVSPQGGDGGVDVIAERAGIRLGVQAKMYGSGSRRVNAQIVRELYGAATCQDCTEFMIATDRALLPEAQMAADKLGVLIRAIAAPDAAERRPQRPLNFDTVWDEHLTGLVGQTLARGDGKTNEILSVDGGGIVRRTSGGARQPLGIEIFRWTIERRLAGETVTRQAIDDRYIGRGSSGVVLILTSLDLFDPTTADGLKALRLTTRTGA